MAKTQKSSEEEKIVKENVEKRFKNMFTGDSEPLSNMSLREVEALKARVAELEEQLDERPAADHKPAETVAESLPPEPLQESIPHLPLKVPAGKFEALEQDPVASATLDKRIALWAAGISAALGLVFFILAVYIVFGIQNGMWELSDKVIMPFTFLMFIAGLVGLRLVRQDRIVPGVWIPYLISVLLGPVITVLFVRGLQTVMGGYLVLFALLFIVLVMPKTSRRLAIFAAIGAALILTGIELWNPTYRLPAGEIKNFSLMIAAPTIMGVLVLFFFANQLRHPGIQARLSILLMVIMVPLLVIISFVITSLARVGMDNGANIQLQATSSGLASGISTWLELNTSALEDLTLQPDIISMNAEQQRPVLQAMAKTHPYMYLVSTTDLNGMNVARNDDGKLTDYKDRAWFQGAKSGAPITYQSLIGKTTGQPALVISMPIKDASGKIVGVAMFAADLTDLSKEVRVSKIGKQGFTLLVDSSNQTLAHPDEKVTAELRDMSTYAPVVALRQGKTGMTTFIDENGERWRAYVSTLENGWAVITQQPESEILAQVNQFQGIVTLLILLGGMIVLVLVWFVTRRTLQPITALTNTVSEIAAGDLNRFVEVGTRDEIGKLAHAFNTMTSQIRNLIGSLEQRVADRTHDLELAAEVGRTAAGKIDRQSEMLTEAVEMIRARFDLYYTQVYLTDPAGEKITLHAGTGEVGKQLLQRGHSLTVSSGSLNGRAVLEKRAQIVPDTSENPTFLPNLLLPKTRSEMCVPLMVGTEVVGVLDMQSEQPGALSESNLPAFEALAGQLAVAIRNAALFAEVRETRAEVEAQMNRFTEQGWDNFLDAIHEQHKIGFAFNGDQAVRLKPETLSTADADCFNLPITVAGAKVGEIQLPAALKPNDLELVKAISEQLAQQVENLRLLAQAETFRKEAEQALRRLTHEGWETYLDTTKSNTAYVYDLNQVQPASEDNAPQTDLAFKRPLTIRGQTVGELKLDLQDASPESIEIISAVAQQLSGHLENLRLSELNEKQAQREQTLRKLTSTLRSSTNPTTIMRTAAREVGRILGRRTVVQVLSSEEAAPTESIQGNANETDSSADRS